MQAPLGPNDFAITQGTAAYAPFAGHVAAAAGASVQGVSVWVREYKAALDAGARPAELRRILDDSGLVCNDVDALIVWAGAGDEASTPLRGLPFELCVESGQVLGARFANLVITGDDGYEFERGVDEFSRTACAVCDAGMIPHLEFVPKPVSPIDDIDKAWAIVEASGVAEAGIMLDTWHFTRGPSTFEMLDRVPVDRILGLQISDVRADAWDDLLDETMHGRLLPGAGVAPLIPILRALRAGGSPAPCTVEIFADEHAALEPGRAARIAVEAARSVVAAARES